MRSSAAAALAVAVVAAAVVAAAVAGDENGVYSPCADARIERGDGFTFGVAFASRDAFFFNRAQQLSPCDSRLSLSSSGSPQLAVFRPKVDEISLLTVNTTSNFDPVRLPFSPPPF